MLPALNLGHMLGWLLCYTTCRTVKLQTHVASEIQELAYCSSLSFTSWAHYGFIGRPPHSFPIYHILIHHILS